jgi:hypothetical protein
MTRTPYAVRISGADRIADIRASRIGEGRTIYTGEVIVAENSDGSATVMHELDSDAVLTKLTYAGS